MKVVVKKPGIEPEICEVSGISEINKLVGNIDKNGIGYNHGGTDIRMSIGQKIDMYIKEDAAINFNLIENLWSPYGNVVFMGTIVFAGYDHDSSIDAGACSMNEEQIDYCLEYIQKHAY